MSDLLVSKIIHLPSFDAVWEPSYAVSAPALRFFERALGKAAAAVAMPPDAEVLRSSLVEIWERTWVKCEDMGAVVVRCANVDAQHVHPPTPFTQESFISRTLDGAERPLQRVFTLMTILKGVLTYPNSPDYRPDIDNLSPVRANIIDTVNNIELTEPGAPSHILIDPRNLLLLFKHRRR
ncbi:hypothetical protein F5888DRAFT_1708427 [Russula emetica]|nr:hypothetical protein F5888DRAFT_1708427 [Russula emetica]